MRRVLWGAALAVMWSGYAYAAPPTTICGATGTAYQSNCAIVNTDGELVVTGTGSGGEVEADITAVGGNPVTTTVPVSGTVTINAIPAGSNIIGNVRIDQTTPGTTNGVSVSQIGSTTVATGNGGVSAGVQRVAIASDSSGVIPTATTLSFLSVNNTTGVSVKASAGTLLSVDCYTTTSATVPLFLKIYNTAGTPTCGSGTPYRRMMIPVNSTGGSGVSVLTGGVAGTALSTGIAYCLTAGVADNDTTAPAANVAVCNINYN